MNIGDIMLFCSNTVPAGAVMSWRADFQLFNLWDISLRSTFVRFHMKLTGHKCQFNFLYLIYFCKICHFSELSLKCWISIFVYFRAHWLWFDSTIVDYHPIGYLLRTLQVCWNTVMFPSGQTGSGINSSFGLVPISGQSSSGSADGTRNLVSGEFEKLLQIQSTNLLYKKYGNLLHFVTAQVCTGVQFCQCFKCRYTQDSSVTV